MATKPTEEQINAAFGRAMREDLRKHGPSGVSPVAADKITIRYERTGRCFWHIGCNAQRHAPPMSIGPDDGERTVIRCTACGEAGYYPHGSVGDVECERASAGVPAVSPAANEGGA